MSQHQDSINLYDQLRSHPVQCDKSLGVQMFSVLSGASSGAGGATLLNAKMIDEPIVIKVFPTDCNVKYLQNKPRENTNLRDYGDYEPGTGLLLTNLFILHHLTQNLTTCYNLSIYNQAYNTKTSMCTRQILPKMLGYPMPTKEQCNIISPMEPINPLCHFNGTYNTVTANSHFELPSRGDIVRFMMVEKCSGDLQGLIESSIITNTVSLEKLDTVLYAMTLMVFHALILFDCVLNGYSHKDLGTRNVLYTWDSYRNKDTYWRYDFPSGESMLSIDIPSDTLIPKIWDFAFVRFGNASQYPNYYEYLSGNRIPNLSLILNEDRENDVYVFLNDIVELMRKKNIITSIFNNLDLNSIRQARNNTKAVYDFLIQMPIPITLLANANHIIIHTFPEDSKVFTGFNINRKVL